MDPLTVINALRESDQYISIIYMNGGCWQFHKVLKVIFPAAEPFKVSINPTIRIDYFDHVVTKIGDRYFDITGEVHLGQFQFSLPMEPGDVEKAEQWSFSKNNHIFKRCPYCYEEILIDKAGRVIEEGG